MKKSPSAADKRLLETFVSRKTVYEGRMVDFVVDTVGLPNGKRATREFMDHPGAVGIVPFIDEDTIAMVRQYRHPVGEITLELPAGKLDAGEPVLACVRRELHEETGYAPRKLTHLLDYWPTCAFANEILHLYVAEGLTAGKRHPDDDEFLDVVRLPFARALEAVRTGRIKDSKTIIGLLACALWRR